MNYTEQVKAERTLMESFSYLRQEAIIIPIMLGVLTAQPSLGDIIPQHTLQDKQIKLHDSSYCTTQYKQKTALTSSLTDFFDCKNYKETISFVNQKAELIPFLFEIKTNVLKFFPGHLLTLELIDDPEGEENEQLVINIQTHFPVDEAMDRLDQFDDEWWLDAMDKAQGEICINLEFT